MRCIELGRANPAIQFILSCAPTALQLGVFTLLTLDCATIADVADLNWQATDWTWPQAEQVLKRMDLVIEALPAAVKQAHERIIGERLVANNEKLLSLFEPDLHVIVRGKAGAEVEFGILLILGEQSEGLIIDWELFKEQVPADTRLVRPSVERVERGLNLSVKGLVTDRRFDNKNEH